jgi:hypothetical protein
MAACLTLIVSEYLAKSAAGSDVRRGTYRGIEDAAAVGAYDGRAMARD